MEKDGLGSGGGRHRRYDHALRLLHLSASEAWADRRYAELPKCDACGELLGETTYRNPDLDYDLQFCSEYCAESQTQTPTSTVRTAPQRQPAAVASPQQKLL